MKLNDLIDLIKNNWDLLLLLIAIIELFVRLIPTFRNYSLIDFIRVFMNDFHDLLNKYLPNIRKDV